MTWNPSTWRPLEPHELLDPETPRDSKARFELWATSPSGIGVAASGQGLDLALLVLHMRGYEDEVYGVLDKIGTDEMSCTATIDFFVGYDMSGHVARNLQSFPAACDYVLALPATSADEYLNERIRRAQDVARAALAKKCAIEAIGEISLGLAKR